MPRSPYIEHTNKLFKPAVAVSLSSLPSVGIPTSYIYPDRTEDAIQRLNRNTAKLLVVVVVVVVIG